MKTQFKDTGHVRFNKQSTTVTFDKQPYPVFLELNWSSNNLSAILRTLTAFRENTKHKQPLDVAKLQKALNAAYPNGGKAPELTITTSLVKFPPLRKGSEVDIYAHEVIDANQEVPVARIVLATDQVHADSIMKDFKYQYSGNEWADIYERDGIYYTEAVTYEQDQD